MCAILEVRHNECRIGTIIELAAPGRPPDVTGDVAVFIDRCIEGDLIVVERWVGENLGASDDRLSVDHELGRNLA